MVTVLPRGLAAVWLKRISVASIAPIIEFATRFLRTLILSRLLNPLEFGTSIALMTVWGTAQMVSDVGFDRFVVLKPEDQGRQCLAVAHALQIARGIVIAACILGLSSLSAAFFSVPAATEAFGWMALVPLIHGFGHLGTKRAYRSYEYRKQALASLANSAVALGAGILAAYLMRDHGAIVVSSIAAEATYVVATHALATEPYEVTWDKEMVREVLSFGLPLMLNGVGLAIFAQADRMIVGYMFGVEILGAYAVVVSLAIVAMSPLTTICSSLAVSALARSRAQIVRLPKVVETIAWAFGTFGIAYCSVLALTLDFVVPKVYGAQHVVAPGVRIALALIALVRILREPATALFLVDGDTRRLSLANMLAGVGLALALCLVAVWPATESVLLGILMGDCLSLVAFQMLLSQRLPAIRPSSLRLLCLEAVLAVVIATTLLLVHGNDLVVRLIVASGCVVALAWMACRTLASASLATGQGGEARSPEARILFPALHGTAKADAPASSSPGRSHTI